MISRGGMGKQLTGNRTKKMAKGGSASKSNAAKGGAKPAAKSGGSAAGKTINTSSTRSNAGGGGGILGGVTNAIRGALSGGNKKMTTVTDPKTGMSYARPSYGAVSLKGLTSSDPANVARNRAAAANYAAAEAQRQRFGSRRDAPVSSTGSAAPGTPTAPVGGVTPTTPVDPASRTYLPPPSSYRPGIDPEWEYYQPRPTVALKKGGRVKPKGKK